MLRSSHVDCICRWPSLPGRMSSWCALFGARFATRTCARTRGLRTLETSSREIVQVTQRDIRSVLAANRYQYVVGHASFLMQCPFCEKGQKSAEKTFFVNKTTGSVVCKPCAVRGKTAVCGCGRQCFSPAPFCVVQGVHVIRQKCAVVIYHSMFFICVLVNNTNAHAPYDWVYVPCGWIYTPAHPCTPLHTPAHSYTPLHTPAHPCTPLHTTAHPCTPLHTPAHLASSPGSFPLSARLGTRLLHTPAHHCTPLRTPSYPYKLLHTPANSIIPLQTPSYPCKLLQVAGLTFFSGLKMQRSSTGLGPLSRPLLSPHRPLTRWLPAMREPRRSGRPQCHGTAPPPTLPTRPSKCSEFRYHLPANIV